MVATSQRRLILAFLALLATLAVVGCARPMGIGTEVGGDRRWVRVTAPKRVMVSTYERAPVFDWRRFVVGRPHSPALSLFQGPFQSCPLAPQGLIGVGVPGAPTMDLAAFLNPESQTLTWSMLERASWLGVTGNECAGNVFAYVRLGLAGSAEPVAVAR